MVFRTKTSALFPTMSTASICLPPARKQGLYFRAAIAGTPGTAVLTRDIRCDALAWYTAAIWQRLRLTVSLCSRKTKARAHRRMSDQTEPARSAQQDRSQISSQGG